MSVSICYLDETGCTGVLPNATAPIQPVFVLSALLVDQSHVRLLTQEFVKLKVQYYPAKFAALKHDLEAMRIEIKGSDLKKDLRGANTKNAQQTAERFLDDLIKLIKKVDGKIVSRIWVKGIGHAFDGKSIYSMTTQKIAKLFQNYLEDREQAGLIIADFRDPRANSIVSHAVFTQMYKRGKKGNAYKAMIEAPLFGISDNHAGLQIVDILSSALICPIATYVYCTGFVNNVHVTELDKLILTRYRKRLRSLEYKSLAGQKKHYGFSVSDRHGNKEISAMWS